MFLDECLYDLKKMVYYDRIDVSEGIDVNKRTTSKWRLSLLIFLKL